MEPGFSSEPLPPLTERRAAHLGTGSPVIRVFSSRPLSNSLSHCNPISRVVNPAQFQSVSHPKDPPPGLGSETLPPCKPRPPLSVAAPLGCPRGGLSRGCLSPPLCSTGRPSGGHLGEPTQTRRRGRQKTE